MRQIIKVAQEEFGLEVVYSHTDSVFIKGGSNSETITKFKLRVAELLNLDDPDDLDEPKQYEKLLFASTNAYVAFYPNDPEPDPTGGVTAIKSDRPNITRSTFLKFIKLVRIGDKASAIQLIKDTIRDMKAGKILTKDLVIEKELHKELWEYDGSPLHVRIAKHLKLRKGDSVKYYHIGKDAKRSRLIEEQQQGAGIQAYLDPKNIYIDKYIADFCSDFEKWLIMLDVEDPKDVINSQ